MFKKTTVLQTVIVQFLIFVSFIGCKNWEYDVHKNGIHYNKIHQSKDGTHTGYMTKNNLIQGFPCEKGWIHYRSDWELLSFQLSEDFIYKTNLLPVHTWIHFPYNKDRTGFVCSFPYDLEIQSHPCGGSGGYKGTHTGFYESGKLRSFFPPKNIEIQGVPCESSPLVNVKLYENGKIKSCKLSQNYLKNSITYKKGKFIEFDEKGKVIEK